MTTVELGVFSRDPRRVVRGGDCEEVKQMTEVEIVQKLENTDQRCRSNTHRLDDLEKRQDNTEKLVTAVEVLATKQQAMESDVREIKVDVKAMAEKPGKRWDAVVDKIVWALLAAVIAFLLGRIGL